MRVRTLVACFFVLGVLEAPAALGGTCAAPADLAECSAVCSTMNACLHCCAQTRSAASVCRAQCAPLAGGGPSRVTRDPHARVPRPARPVHVRPGSPAATPTPVIDATRFTAQCTVAQTADRLTVRLEVTNGTGVDLNTVITRVPVVQTDAGTKVSMGKVPSPRSYATVAAGASAVFEWTGRIRLGGTAGFSVAAAALSPGGDLVETALVDCGTVGGSEPTPQPTVPPSPPPQPSLTPTPRATTSPTTPSRTEPPSAVTAEALQCASCHDTSLMAFAADTWLDSAHAATKGPGRDNTFCANCHSPLQANAAASAANNAIIPDSQWQGVTCSVCHPSDAESAGWTTPIGTYNVATRTHSPVPVGDADVLCTQCHTGEFAPGFVNYGDYMHFAGVRCIDCHMPQVPTGDATLGNRTAHDLKVAGNLPYSCGTYPGGCHARRPTSWAVRILQLGPIHPASQPQ